MKYNAKARHKARRLAMQAVYQWQFNHSSAREIELQFIVDDEMKNADVEHFKDLLHGVLKQIPELDKIFMPFIDRPLEDITPVELAVLRVATYELKNRLDIPYRVVINEALELNKTFGTDDGYKFVNGVLDKLARSLRKEELNKN